MSIHGARIRLVDVVDDHVDLHGILLARHERPNIGVLVDPNAAFVHRMLERFAELRWQVVDLNAFQLRPPDQMKFAGALLSCLPTEPFAQRLLAKGVPAVRLGNLAHPDDHLMPAIVPDQLANGRLAAEHFAERGFVHMGFVGYTPWRDRQLLYEGYHSRAVELGRECHLLSLDEDELRSKVTPTLSFHSIQKQYVIDWWRSLPRPLGLLASGDMAAHRYCQWAIEAGLRVPEDVAVLGVGNIPLTCEGAIVPLSSIDSNMLLTIDHAIHTLRRLIDGESPDAPTIHIPPRGIITRRSTDVLAAQDPHVVKALRFMWDHVTENLGVDQIAAHVGVSRRTLAKGFQRDLGRGINAEFQRRRLEKVREVLTQTDLPIGRISGMFQFSSQSRLCRVFKDAYGQTPADYRDEPQSSG